jgi:3-oxoacyl-[acyl-carrier-protein] synthase-1
MQLEIAAMGMDSCLGPLTTACAAFRAGISRVRASREFRYFPEGDNAPRPLQTCAIPVNTFGFSAAGRLVAILCGTLGDLQSRLKPGDLGTDTALFLALPDPLERDFPMRAELMEDPPRRMEALGQFVLRQTFESFGMKWRGLSGQFFGGGQVAFARALLAARTALDSRSAGACLVVAVDSFLSPPTLSRLVRERRVKTDDFPVGFIPGEVGVAMLLRPVFGTRREGASSPVFIRQIHVLESPDPKQAEGRALASCAEGVLPPPGGPAPEAPLLVSDHNGEQRRAREWGSLQIHLQAAHPDWTLGNAWFPAIGFGETGAASGAVGACVAARGLERGYARSRSALVLNTSEDGARAAIFLDTFQPGARA